MAILADQHMHSSFSADSQTALKDMVEKSIELGLKTICPTEHMDIGYPPCEEWPEHCWECNVDSYLYELLTLKEQYKDRININFGIELGLQESVFRENALTAKAHEFDFIIGSLHLVNGRDCAYPVYFENRSVKDAYEEYFKAVIANIKKFKNFDVLGHLDYIIRYSPDKGESYSPSDYMDYIDEILDILLENEKGIEINTSRLARGASYTNPHKDVVKRYKEKGGEIITIGSDAHNPSVIACGFNVAEEILKDCGFKYYSVFEKRVATYHRF